MQGRAKTWLISGLRRISMRWPARNECLSKAKTTRKKNKKTNRLAQHYKCKGCKKDFPLKEVVVDHIQPVVCPKEGFVDWDTYINRMFCSLDNFQVLCNNGKDSCHAKKTSKERECRRSGKTSQG